MGAFDKWRAGRQGEEDVRSTGVDPGSTEKYVGAHLSIVGGIDTIQKRAESVGGRAAALFLKNQRTHFSKPLDPAVAKSFLERTAKIRPYLIPHASYLINLATPDKEKGERSLHNLLDEIRRCDALDIPGSNLHPGSNVGNLPIKDACLLISQRINQVHEQTTKAMVVIENMAGQGRVIGSSFRELGMIIEEVKDKKRIGVCLDTCHLFGAGYDIRTEEKFERVMEDFDREVGMEYLRAVHLNDSKEPLGSRKDRHECIGKGLIGLGAFRYIMNSSRFNNIPMVLETPDPSKYAEEIALLYGLVEPCAPGKGE